MTQEQAAEAVGVSVTTWGRWERDEQEIRPGHWRQIADCFGIDVAEMERSEGVRLPFWVNSDFFRMSVPDAVEMLATWWGFDVDASRRHILASLPWIPAALPEWLISWSFDPAEAPMARAGGDRSVGLEDVRRVDEARQAFTRMDHQYGAGLVRPAVADFLNRHVAPLLRGSYTEKVGAQLMSAAAGMSRLAGFMAYDLGWHGQAQQQLGHALRLAKAGGDQMTAVSVLAAMARQAEYARDPQWALRLARAARGTAEQAGACSRLMAWLLIREARATAQGVALAGTVDGHAAGRVQRLIGAAEQAFTQARPGDEVLAWAFFLNEAELAAHTGDCWHMIGKHDRAAACAERALAGYGDQFARSYQLTLVSAAEAYLGQGELEQSLASARAAVLKANTLTSHRCVRYIRNFDAQLDPHEHDPHVREWREYLRAELRAA